MPIYYFDLNNEDSVADTDGTELPNLEAAREHAAGVARELTFKRTRMLNRSWSHWTMSVRDSSGQEVLSFSLGEGDFRKAAAGTGDDRAP